jgi:hypothetical protein
MPTDYDDLLDAYLAGEADDDFHPEVEGEPPDLADAEHVDKALRRIRRLTDERDQIATAAKRRIEEVKAWHDDLVAGIDRDVAWWERAVLGYAAKHFEGQPKTVRTVNLPSGQLLRRKQQTRVPDHPEATVAGIHDLAPDLAPTGKPTLAKQVVKDRCVAGKALGPVDDEGYQPHQAVLRVPDPETGEVTETVVPGLILLVPMTDKITYKPGG